MKDPLWMDEVLAVWVARLPTYHQVWSAVLHGSETSPPTYHVLLHFLKSTVGGSNVLLRLPSILASLISGIFLFVLLRRYLGTAAAAYGAAFTLLGVLSYFGNQARPYTMVAACFMAAALLWDRVEPQRPKLWRICAIAGLLICAESLHFYATLLVPCMGMMELLWSILSRRFRISVWLGFILAGVASLAWLPFIQADTRFNAGDTRSIAYYAVPTPGKLIHAYCSLMIYDKKQTLFLILTLVAIGVISLICSRFAVNCRTDVTEEAFSNRSRTNLYVIAFSAVTFPLVTYVFSLAVTRTFNLRYALIGTFGFACLLACVVERAQRFTMACWIILLPACPLALLSAIPDAISVADQLVLAEYAPKPYPVVVGEGQLYFELEEAAPPEMKSRLTFLKTPPGVVNPDPTNEHLLDRWHVIRPDLQILDAKDFFAANPRYYLLHTNDSTDALTPWLMKHGAISKPVVESRTQYQDGWLFEAEAPR